MPTATVTVQTISPDEPWGPSDDALGNYLVGLVAAAVDDGGGAPAIVAGWRTELQILPILPIIEAGWKPDHFLASLSRTVHPHLGLPEVVGTIGRLRFRNTEEEPWLTMAAVFLEWPDGRWWRWRQLLDTDSQRIAETAIWDCAADGLPRPDHLGGWWRLGRLGAPPLQIFAEDGGDTSIVQ